MNQRVVSLLLGSASVLSSCSGSDHTHLGLEAAEGLESGEALLASEQHRPASLPDLDLGAVSCGSIRVTDAGRSALSRLPYLQRVTARSAAVLFELREPADSIIEISSPAGEVLQVRSPYIDLGAPDGLQRVASFTGLQPGTTHCFSLPGWTERTAFRTAPLPNTNAAFRFVVFGDSGTGGDDQRAVRAQLESVPFDLMLHTGDMAYESGTLEQFESTFFAIYEELLGSVPVFPVAGNHDYRTDDASPFRQVFDLPDNGVPSGHERWYSFDWGDVHFVALDTEYVEAVEQTNWLERDLARNQRPWVVVYMHKPPFSSGHHGGSSLVQDTFVPLFERHGVDLVLAGHEHDYERTLPIQGVTYVVTGGGGRYLRSVGSSWFTAYSESVFHFVYVEVLGSTLRLHAIDNQGREVDSAVLTR